MADIHILVADDSAGQRLDAYLGANDGCPTRSTCAHLIEGGAVAVNGETCLSKKYAVRAGDRISVDLPEPHDPTDVIPEAIPLDIRYEDDYLIVLSKQRGLVCHPAHGHESGTLANALVYHCGIDHLGTVQGEDRPGIVHAVTGVIGESGGNVIQSQQFGDPDTGTFFMRVEVDSPQGRAPIDEGLTRVAEEFSATYRVDDLGRKLRTIIMVSREGHCLTDLLYRQQTQGLPIDVIAVVGNHPDLAPVAQFYGVPFLNIPVTKDTKAQAERQLLDLIASENVELVVLARYMQILSDEVCRAMQGRVINIHHSFLPSFKGARPYAQAHDRGVKLIGATAHYVTADLDEGPIIEQDVTRVSHADSTPDMVALGQDVERRVLAQAVRFHAERRVLMNGNRTVVFSR